MYSYKCDQVGRPIASDVNWKGVPTEWVDFYYFQVSQHAVLYHRAVLMTVCLTGVHSMRCLFILTGSPSGSQPDL